MRLLRLTMCRTDLAAAQDDTSRMNHLLTPDELLETMHTQPTYTLIIEKEEQI